MLAIHELVSLQKKLSEIPYIYLVRAVRGTNLTASQYNGLARMTTDLLSRGGQVTEIPLALPSSVLSPEQVWEKLLPSLKLLAQTEHSAGYPTAGPSRSDMEVESVLHKINLATTMQAYRDSHA